MRLISGETTPLLSCTRVQTPDLDDLAMMGVTTKRVCQPLVMSVPQVSPILRAFTALPLLFCLSFCISLSSVILSSAQSVVTQCGGGYSLTSLARDLKFNSVTDGPVSPNITVNLCGAITSGTCAGMSASVCIESGSNDAGAVAAYYSPDTSPVVWAGEYNLIQWMNPQNGYQCDGQGWYTLTFDIQCDYSALQPYISDVDINTGVGICEFTGLILMAEVCLPPLPPSQIAIGQSTLLTPASPCGSGLYNLSGLDSHDFEFVADGLQYWWRPCSTVTTSNCYTGPNAPNSYDVTFCQDGQDLVKQPIFQEDSLTYGTTTILTSSGLLLQGADGRTCRGGEPRGLYSVHTNVFLVCHESACYPSLLNSSYSNNNMSCLYTFYIATSAICPQYRLPDPQPVWAIAPATVIPAGTCGGAGFDVSQSAVDMQAMAQPWWVAGDYFFEQYLLHPCGEITNTSFMMAAVLPLGEGLAWGVPYIFWPPDTSWIAVPGGVQLSMYFWDAYDFFREALVLFLCVPSALTPYFAFVVVDQNWDLTTAVVWTAQACTCNSSSISQQYRYGVSWRSEVCGGGVYNLSSVGNIDMSVSLGTLFHYSPVTLTFRLCGAVNEPACPFNSSVCLWVNTSSTSPEWYPPEQVIDYQPAPLSTLIVNPFTGQFILQMAFQSSVPRPCNIDTNLERPRMLVFLYCDGNAVQPYFDFGGYADYGYLSCLTQFNLYTAAVCTQLTNPPQLTCPPGVPPLSSNSSLPSIHSINGTAGLELPPLCSAPSVPASSSSSGLNSGAIAGIVVGAVVGAALLCGAASLGVLLVASRRRKKERATQSDTAQGAQPTTELGRLPTTPPLATATTSVPRRPDDTQIGMP